MKANLNWACFALAVCASAVVSRADEPSSATLADQAVSARYLIEQLLYEKLAAERTIKGNQGNIEQSTKGLPQFKAAVEKAEQELKTAKDDLAVKAAALAAAKEKAASGSDDDKAALAKADQEHKVAELTVRQKDNNYQRDSGTLQRNLDRIKKSEADIAAATARIPQKEAALVDARKIADELRTKAALADEHRAAGQTPQVVSQQIDALIDARLKSQNIPASPVVDDAEFLRRVTLDITGTIPKYEDVIAFLDDASPHKPAALVNRLLSDAAFGRNFAQRFCTVTTESGTSTLTQARDVFRDWLAESLNMNRRWDGVASDMISGEGRGFEQPAALFTVAYRMNEQPDPALLLGAVGDHFLGLQIQCAQCHDHPFHEWQMGEFWSMAAMLGRVRLKGEIQNARDLEHLVTDADVDPKELLRMNGIKYAEQMTGGRIGIPDPVNAGEVLRTVSARFLDGVEPKLPEKGNYRQDFARWVVAKENPYFARATVNRIWSHFFGRGIVEPILNLHPDNAPAHPDVLDLLADEFKRADYDVKHLVRCITLTQTYRRSCKRVPGNEQDDKLFSHMAVKPLDSYVLIDALSVALRRTPQTGQQRRDAAAAFDTRLPGSDPQKYTHSIPQVLKLMNTRDYSEVNAMVNTVTNGKSTADGITHLYLALLARRPTEVESAEMLAYVNALDNPRQGLADVYWVLLNSAEFLVNH